MQRFFILAFALVTSLAACNEPGDRSELRDAMDSLSTDRFELAEGDSAAAQPIKSGIIYMQSTTPIRGSDVERIVHFDDYGNKRHTETTTRKKAGTQIVSTTQIRIDADGRSFTYDPEKKYGTVTKVDRRFNPTQIDFSRVDKQTMEDFGIKKEGTETVAGKLCTVYSIDYPMMGFRGRYAVWNNLPLHEQFSTADFGYEYIATRLVENAEIPESRFAPPSDIEFYDSDNPQLQQRRDSLANLFDEPAQQ